MMKIVGAKGNINNVDELLCKISTYSEKYNIIIQIFDAELIFGKKHLMSAAKHAIRAFKEKTNTTSSINMEILLYASGERQLKHAIPKIGIKKRKTDVAFIFIDNLNKASSNKKLSLDEIIREVIKQLSLERDDKVLEGDKNTLKRFGISEKEIKTVKEDRYMDLILERVAMVDILK